MAYEIGRRAATLVVVMAALVAAGCSTLPRSGPLASDIEAAPEEIEGLVAPITFDLAARADRGSPDAMPAAFRQAQPVDPDLFRSGDLLDILVWDPAETPLLGGQGGAMRLETTPIDAAGNIYIPFVGAVKADGMKAGGLRRSIGSALSALTIDPQVDVRLNAPRSRMITVQGAVGQPGAYAIEREALTLAPMLALAGGSALPPEQVAVTVRRGGVAGVATLAEIYADPALDIALRPDDRIFVTPLRSRFIALGATGSQAEVSFPTARLSLLSAIATARGLRDNDADPRGVFVFRFENRELADSVLAGPPPPDLPIGETRPIIYRLDLTEPGALFAAQRFQMRDGDALLATNAPSTELRKFFQIFNTVLAPASSVESLAVQ